MKQKILIMTFTALGVLLSGISYAAGGAGTEAAGSKMQGQGKKLLPAVQMPSASNPGMARSGEAHGGMAPITGGPKGNGGMVMGKPITGGPNGNGGMAPITGGPKGGGVQTPGGTVMDKGDETAQKPGGHLPRRDASSGRVQRTDDEGTTDTHRGGPPKSAAQSKQGFGAARGGTVAAPHETNDPMTGLPRGPKAAGRVQE
jgi:hypothetical protein